MGYQPNLPPSQHLAVVALYDPASGDILHWHCASADDAAHLPSPQALEKEAVDHALHHAPAETQPGLKKAGFVHVDQKVVKGHGPFKVDTRTRTLVELN